MLYVTFLFFVQFNQPCKGDDSMKNTRILYFVTPVVNSLAFVIGHYIAHKIDWIMGNLVMIFCVGLPVFFGVVALTEVWRIKNNMKDFIVDVIKASSVDTNGNIIANAHEIEQAANHYFDM